MIKSRTVRWEALYHEWGRGGMYMEYWWESQKERSHWENEEEGWWTILKWILERQDRVVWTGSIWFWKETSEGLL
jgi:hypothetical protein